MPPPKFIFVRHGEAEHNVAFHEVGNAAFTDPKYKDARLTEEGHKQARATGEALQNLKILDLWCSPLTRCIQTAEEIFEANDITNLVLHDSLLERQCFSQPCNERRSRGELRKEFPMFKRDYLSEMTAYFFKPEPPFAIHQRMMAFALWLAHHYKDAPPDSHLVLVSHGHAIGYLTGKTLKNAEYVVMSLDELTSIRKDEPTGSETLD